MCERERERVCVCVRPLFRVYLAIQQVCVRVCVTERERECVCVYFPCFVYALPSKRCEYIGTEW